MDEKLALLKGTITSETKEPIGIGDCLGEVIMKNEHDVISLIGISKLKFHSQVPNGQIEFVPIGSAMILLILWKWKVVKLSDASVLWAFTYFSWWDN